MGVLSSRKENSEYRDRNTATNKTLSKLGRKIKRSKDQKLTKKANHGFKSKLYPSKLSIEDHLFFSKTNKEKKTQNILTAVHETSHSYTFDSTRSTAVNIQSPSGFEPKQSRIIARSRLITVTDCDTWIEALAISNDENDGKIRSYFYSKKTKKSWVWDEPPSGAGQIVYITPAVREMTQNQLKSMVELRKSTMVGKMTPGGRMLPFNPHVDNYDVEAALEFRLQEEMQLAQDVSTSEVEKAQAKKKLSTPKSNGKIDEVKTPLPIEFGFEKFDLNNVVASAPMLSAANMNDIICSDKTKENPDRQEADQQLAKIAARAMSNVDPSISSYTERETAALSSPVSVSRQVRVKTPIELKPEETSHSSSKISEKVTEPTPLSIHSASFTNSTSSNTDEQSRATLPREVKADIFFSNTSISRTGLFLKAKRKKFFKRFSRRLSNTRKSMSFNSIQMECTPSQEFMINPGASFSGDSGALLKKFEKRTGYRNDHLGDVLNSPTSPLFEESNDLTTRPFLVPVISSKTGANDPDKVQYISPIKKSIDHCTNSVEFFIDELNIDDEGNQNDLLIKAMSSRISKIEENKQYILDDLSTMSISNHNNCNSQSTGNWCIDGKLGCLKKQKSVQELIIQFENKKV